MQHLVNARLPVSPAKSHRSSIRPVARTSDIDFDKIPSPRPSTSSQRNARNGVEGNARNGVPGSSKSARFMRMSEPEPDSDSPDPGPGEQDIGMDLDPFDDYAQQESHSPDQVSARRKSFSRIEEEVDEDEEQELENVGLGLVSEDDEEEEQEEPPPPAKKAKTEGKNPQKAQTQSKSKKENRCMSFNSCRPFYLSDLILFQRRHRVSEEVNGNITDL